MKASEVVEMFQSFPPDTEVCIDWVRQDNLNYLSDEWGKPRVTDEEWERYVWDFDGNLIEPLDELNIILGRRNGSTEESSVTPVDLGEGETVYHCDGCIE